MRRHYAGCDRIVRCNGGMRVGCNRIGLRRNVSNCNESATYARVCACMCARVNTRPGTSLFLRNVYCWTRVNTNTRAQCTCTPSASKGAATMDPTAASTIPPSVLFTTEKNAAGILRARTIANAHSANQRSVTQCAHSASAVQVRMA